MTSRHPLSVVYEESGGGSRVAEFGVSLQQAAGGPQIELHRAVRESLREELHSAAANIPGLDPTVPQRISVNGAGDFVVGGTEGDNGLSGKKLVVDAFGPRVPIGGGALSGKDICKADRAGALMARRIARAVVLTGAARECAVALRILPGEERFSILSIVGGNGAGLAGERWAELFDLSLAGAGDRHTGVANLVDVARYGHFTIPLLPWRLQFA